MTKPDYEFCLNIRCPKIINCRKCSLKGMLRDYAEYAELGTVTEIKDLLEQQKASLNRHNEMYTQRLLKGDSSWNLISDEMLEERPFPVTNPIRTLGELKELNPNSFLAFMNGLIKQIQMCFKNRNRLKSEYQGERIDFTYSTLVSGAYRRMGSFIEECQFEYYSIYETKAKSVMETLSEFPEARYRIIRYFSELEKSYFFTDEEVKIREEKMRIEEENEIKRIKEQEEIRQDNARVMESFGFVIQTEERRARYGDYYWKTTKYKTIIDRNDEDFFRRKKEILDKVETIMEKYHCRKVIAIDMLVEKMPNFKNVRNFIKEEGQSISRPEIIAASDRMFHEFQQAYHILEDV